MTKVVLMKQRIIIRSCCKSNCPYHGLSLSAISTVLSSSSIDFDDVVSPFAFILFLILLRVPFPVYKEEEFAVSDRSHSGKCM